MQTKCVSRRVCVVLIGTQTMANGELIVPVHLGDSGQSAQRSTTLQLMRLMRRLFE